MAAIVRFLMNVVRVCYPFLYMLLAVQFLVLILTPGSTGGQRLYPMLAAVLPVLEVLTTILAFPILLVFNGIGSVLPAELRLWFPVADLENTMYALSELIDAVPLMDPVAKPIRDYDWHGMFGGGFHWAYLAAIWMWWQLEKAVLYLFEMVEAGFRNMEAGARSEKLRQSYERGDHIPKGKKTEKAPAMIFDRPKQKEPEFREVVETLKQESASLKERVNQDPLTGLYNKAYFNNTLAREVDMLRPMEGQLGLLLMDIDDFKKLNDVYGHPQGDQIIKTVAVELQKLRSFQGSLLPCRIGGEELALILSGVAADEAARLAEQFRHSIERLSFPHPSAPDGQIRTTVSAGLLTVKFSNSTESALMRPADMVQRADELLYRAKNNGKNRVEVWRVE